MRAFLGVLAHDHALVALVTRLDVERAALLQRVERVGDGLVGMHGDHGAVLATAQLATHGPVFREAMAEDGLAVTRVEDLGT